MSPTALAQASQCTLVVVDMQTRLAAAMDRERYPRVRQGVATLLRAAGLLGLPVLYTEHCRDALGGTDPALRASLPPGACRIDKTAFSAAAEDEFCNALEITGRPEVVLCGLEAHVCVLQSALSLQAQGYRVFVAADAVMSRAFEHCDNALARLRQQGVVVSNTESVLFEWAARGDHPALRDLLDLIR